MIESLHISGFKLFRDITLPKLGRLNLFVGENNTGKSCLLEAIGLYAGGASLTDVLETAARRSASALRPWEANTTREQGASILHPVFDLFHRTGLEAAVQFLIGKVGDSRSFRVEWGFYQRVASGEGPVRYVLVDPKDSDSDPAEIALAVYRGDKQVDLVTRRMLPAQDRISGGEKFWSGDTPRVAFLSARGFQDSEAAAMWDALVQGPGQDLVLDWLRMLDSRIESLAYIEGALGSRVALLKLQGEPRVPLRPMGDGMTKLFHIALAVASASQGVLLIDEFENGLHWTVQEKLWQALARAARSFNVQIFSATHSRDCIAGFTAAAKELDPGDALIYRLERKGDGVFAMDLPLINVEAAMREHGEVR